MSLARSLVWLCSPPHDPAWQDPRNFVAMRDAGCPVTADVTHALQQVRPRAARWLLGLLATRGMRMLPQGRPLLWLRAQQLCR